MATLSVCRHITRRFLGLTPSINVNGTLLRYNSTEATPVDSKETSENCKEQDDQTSVDTLTKQIEQLTTEKDKIKASQEETMDKYKRALAETENVRRRMQKQIDDAKMFGIQGFCKDLLEVADILNKATESVPKDLLQDETSPLFNLFQGLTMTETQLQKVFNRHGLYKIDPCNNEKFDPNLHEALFEQPVPGKEPGTVALVTKLGYKLHDRTIRPALVGVVKS